MQHRPKALALALGLLLVVQVTAFALFRLDASSQDKTEQLASMQLASISRSANIHWANGEHLWEPPPPPPPPPPVTIPPPRQQTHKATPKAHYVLLGANTGDFASCVRQKESSNNYAYSGYYHGAYNMTLSHWDNYGGYSSPESAPPSVQDAKFQSDVAQGSGYMHQQYPRTSRMCGM